MNELGKINIFFVLWKLNFVNEEFIDFLIDYFWKLYYMYVNIDGKEVFIIVEFEFFDELVMLLFEEIGWYFILLKLVLILR